MSLVKRVCPLCKAEDYSTVVVLKQHNFTKNNPSYRLDRIQELGLDPDQHYPIVSCRRCGMFYSLYHLNDKQEAIVYNQIIDTEISRNKVLTIRRKLSDLKRWQNLLALANTKKHSKPSLKLLDYGCGWGTLLLTAKGPGIDTVGFEVANDKIDWARKQGAVICSSPEELFAKAPYDICVSTSILEHLRDPEKVAKKLSSLMKPGGYAHITAVIGGVVPHLFWRKIRRSIKKSLSIPKEVNPWEHLNYFTHRTLVILLERFGFTPLASSGKRRLISMLPKIWSSGYWQLRKTRQRKI